jgi:iron complex outermembrane receptor protein
MPPASQRPPRNARPHAAQRFPLTPIAVCAGLCAAALGSARAQTAVADAAPRGGAAAQTVTVSGDRSFGAHLVQVGAFRDQDPLDVPLTNNVVTREVLDAQGVRTLFGALRYTAGVTRSQLSGSTYDNISIRGILVENRGNYRLNGSLPIVNLIDVPLENKERVEVLKGSSSLYYGLVPPSGVVNFVTKRAGKDAVASVAVSANQHGAADVHVDLGRRFGSDDAMGLRVNVAGGREDIGIDGFSGERGLASLAYDWRVNSRLSLKLDLEHYRKDVSEQAAIALLPAANGVIALPPVPDNRRNLAGEWQRYDAEATNALVRADVALADDWTLALEAGKARTTRDRRFSQFQSYDLASGEGQLRISFADGQRYTNTNGRIEVLGRVATGLLAHELTLGTTHNRREAYSGAAAANANVAQNLYTPRPVAELEPALTPGTDSTIVDKGAYLVDRISIGERWQALLGVRYADFRNTTATSTYSATETSPNVSLLYRPWRDLSFYASYLEGLEETGTAPANQANSGEILPPSVNKQKELGVKARLAGSTLLQAAVFDIDRPQTTIDAGNRFVLGGRSRYRGAELSASGEIARHWALVASALWLDAEIVQVGASNAAELGKTPENTPRQTLSLFAEYRVPQVAGWAVSAGLYHVGKRMVNNANQAELPAYTTLSLGTRYVTRWDGRPVTLQANVDNATDRDYWSSAGNGLLGAGLPRTLRVAAKVDF